MNAIVQPRGDSKTPAYQYALEDPNWVKWSLMAIAIGFIVLFLCVR